MIRKGDKDLKAIEKLLNQVRNTRKGQRFSPKGEKYFVSNLDVPFMSRTEMTVTVKTEILQTEC